MAAVLNWRLPGPAPTNVQGPLPWLPGVPQAINDHPNFGAYLAQRSQLITDLADHVRRQTGHNGTQPVWAPLGRPLSADIIGEVAVWRAANGIDPHDRRPTGPEQLLTAPALWQQDLDRQVQHHSDETVDYSIQEARAASKTVKGLRSDERDHRPPLSEAYRRSLPRGPSL